MSLEDIRGRVRDAAASSDWDGILRWEERIDELVAGQDQRTTVEILQMFARAYGQRQKFDRAGLTYGRAAEVYGESKLLSEQVHFLTRAGESFTAAGNSKNAVLWFESTRDVSAELGCVSLESRTCSRLGQAFTGVGRWNQAAEQHRRAVRVAQSVGQNDAFHDRASVERAALRGLVEVLCMEAGHEEEAEALLVRLREVGDTSAECRLWNNYLRGVFHFFNHNFQAAAEAFRAAVVVAGKHPEVLGVSNTGLAFTGAKYYLEQCGGGAGGAPPLYAVVEMVGAAAKARDWSGVLRWESRLEELALGFPSQMFHAFAWANLVNGKFVKAASLFQRRAEAHGMMKLFGEQGADMCKVGDCFELLNDAEGAETWFKKARKLGETTGCLESECVSLNPEP